MGRYRPLLAELVRHTNLVQRYMSAQFEVDDGIFLNLQEWQVLEYIIEHLHDDAHMYLMSDRLGIPQSSFSKTVKVLCNYGLVEKYQMTNNRKNIILRPSDFGLAIYEKHSSSLIESTFSDFFRQLESFSDEDINRFMQAVEILNNSVSGFFRPPTGELVKIEQKH